MPIFRLWVFMACYSDKFALFMYTFYVMTKTQFRATEKIRGYRNSPIYEIIIIIYNKER
jgi:hypothetical protein